MFGEMIFTIGLTKKQEEINMWIYNFLFYKSFLLAQKNSDDMPVLGAMPFVVGCITFNIVSILLFIGGLGFNITLTKTNELFYGVTLAVLIIFYYLYKGRYKKIIEHYRQKTGFIVQLHPIIVIIIYLGLSVLLMFIAAAFKNHDWFFAP